MDVKNQYMPINIMIIDGEVFIPIYSLKGRYYISIYGNKIFSNIYKKILKTQTKQGYYYNNLQKEPYKQSKIFYHRALAEMMLLKTSNRNHINHKNSKRNDNTLKNIEWVYSYENRHHAQGKQNYIGLDNKNIRLFSDDEIVDIYTSCMTRNELKKKYPKLTNMTLHDIKKGAIYKDVTENLSVGKSIQTKRLEYINNLSDSFFYHIWQTYITTNKSLKELQKEYNISTSTLRKRFKKMALPLKDNKGRINIHVNE